MSRITTERNNGVSFGQWLKEHRNALRLSREELADRVGCSPETIYKVEAGTRLPSRQVAQILAGFFGVPAEEHEAFTAFARGQGSGVGESEGVSVSRDAPWR